MAKIVSVIASTHNPRIFWNRDQADPTDMATLYATFGEARRMLAETKPDLIVGVANDHLDNFFFDNLPTFAVGTGPVAEGPFWYETDVMNLPRYRAKVHQGLAQFLLRDGIEKGIQFSQVHEFRIDHAFTVPLSFVRPEEDLPVVPIMTNAFGYPIPHQSALVRARPVPARRNRSLARLGTRRRGWLLQSHGRGRRAENGQLQFRFAALDARADAAGNRDEILKMLTVPRLIEEGNSTSEFLNYVTVWAWSSNATPTFIDHKPVKGVGTCPVAFWNMGKGIIARQVETICLGVRASSARSRSPLPAHAEPFKLIVTETETPLVPNSVTDLRTRARLLQEGRRRCPTRARAADTVGGGRATLGSGRHGEYRDRHRAAARRPRSDEAEGRDLARQGACPSSSPPRKRIATPQALEGKMFGVARVGSADYT